MHTVMKLVKPDRLLPSEEGPLTPSPNWNPKRFRQRQSTTRTDNDSSFLFYWRQRWTNIAGDTSNPSPGLHHDKQTSLLTKVADEGQSRMPRCMWPYNPITDHATDLEGQARDPPATLQVLGAGWTEGRGPAAG